MGYFKDTVIGFSWMGSFRAITRIGSFIRIAILARLLTPSQFGLFGIASIMLILLETFTETGINVFLIQERKELKEYVDTAWIVSIVRGIIVAIILILLAPLIAKYFSAPDSAFLVVLIALVAFIRGFINPSRVKYIKDLEFNKEVWFGGAIFVIDSLVAVSLAYILKSPISLVWGLVAGAALEVILSFVFIKPIPKLVLDTKKLIKVISRGKWVTGSGIFNYLFQQGDDIVVGKLLSTASLGIYQVAYKISTLPLTEVTKIIHQVTFPIYTNIAGDKIRLKKAYIRTIIITSILVIPIGLIIFLFPSQIVRIILGDKWIDVIPILKVLSIFGVLRAITLSSNSLFYSVKKQNYVTAITLTSLITMAILILPLTIKWGLLGASTSVLLGSLSVVPLVYFYTRKVLS